MSRPHHRSTVTAAGRRAFTLIELLVVIAIIAMLIGIVMPGLSKARDQAKNVTSRGTMKAISDGLEMFVGEVPEECAGQNYPPSGGGKYFDDPTAAGGKPDDTTGQVALGDEQIFGCQWIVRYLMGKNLDGYVPKRNVPKAFDYVPPEDGMSQKLWYGSPGDQDWPEGVTEPLPRVGPYMNNPPIKAPRDIVKTNAPLMDDSQEDAKYTNWVFIDAYQYPILYYAARSGYANRPDAIQTVYGDPEHPECSGIYNWRDNALFTGLTTMADDGSVTADTVTAWDLGAGPHKLTFGPESWKNQSTSGTAWRTVGQRADILAQTQSFAYQIMNKQAFETSYSLAHEDASKATIVPMRRDSFLLWSPGKDGLFGTGDDVKNWQ